MKIKELINILLQYPLDTQVMSIQGGEPGVSHIKIVRLEMGVIMIHPFGETKK